jgi:hypothetical protein
LPKEVLAAVEAVLTEQGFYQGEAEGYFRPDARKALSAWVTAKGPLPPADLAETAASTAGPALPDVPAAVLERANAMAIEAIRSGRSDEEKAAALGMVADLARFGDPQSRWALLRNYHAPEAEMLRAIVSPAEITRFGIDLLLTADPSMEKLDGEFTFAMSQIYVDGHTAEFAESFVAMLREDARLRNRPVLGDVLMAVVFIPGACDAAIDRAIAEGATSLTRGGYCGDLPVRDGFLAFADNAPPSDVEAARRAAAAKIKALADLAAAQ